MPRRKASELMERLQPVPSMIRVNGKPPERAPSSRKTMVRWFMVAAIIIT